MIAIIAILIGLLIPAVSAVRERAQMTGTMNNARQLYLAQFQMSNDGSATGDTTLVWPGDLTTPPTTITDYLNILCGKGYLRGADAIKLMNAPGAQYTATVNTAGGVDSLSAGGGTPALKVWMNQDVDPATTIFCTSHNYKYDTPLNGTDVPYGTKGFITIRKGGDASVYRVGQATHQGWPAGGTVFQNSVGSKVGDPVGGPTTGDPTTPGVGVLTAP